MGYEEKFDYYEKMVTYLLKVWPEKGVKFGYNEKEYERMV